MKFSIFASEKILFILHGKVFVSITSPGIPRVLSSSAPYAWKSEEAITYEPRCQKTGLWPVQAQKKLEA